MTIRAVVACLLIVGPAATAAADSTLKVEVREPKKARMVSADVWIRNTSGKLLRKVFAAGGRAQVRGLPSGTVILEVRSRKGNLFAKTQAKARRGRVVRVAVKLKPAPKTSKASVAKPGAPKTARAKMKSNRTPHRVKTRRHKTGRVTMTNDRRTTAAVAGVPKSTKKQTATAKATTAKPKDWGHGKRRVCRGDVFDKRGRHISGRLLVRRGSKVLGFARVNAGRFSLYDLQAGTYRLEFTDSQGKQHASSTVVIKANRLPKVILRAR